MDLIVFNKVRQALEEAVTVNEVKDIRDRAEALRVYVKQVGEGLEMQNRCCEIKVRAERKIGHILQQVVQHGGDRKSKYHDDTLISQLDEIGVSRLQSSRWQMIASIPDHIFELHISEITGQERELTSVGLLKVAKQLKQDHRLEYLRNLESPAEDFVVHCTDCVEFMKQMEESCIDLTVTSPPYDQQRDQHADNFEWQKVAEGLYRVTKPGGVVVWVVADSTINGSESGTSFQQALYFREIGFQLHDTMIYLKTGTSYPPDGTRYTQVFEYMFIFTKGRPKTFNPICDVPKYHQGSWGELSVRAKNGTLIKRNLENEGMGSLGRAVDGRYGYKQRTNVWTIRNGAGFGHSDDLAVLHPSTFPEQLAEDHIVTWTNPGDLVFDPMCGSGTTLKAAKKNQRRCLGVDINPEYCEIARRRLALV